MIKEVSSDEVLDFILKFFPNYKISSDPFEKIFVYFDHEILGFISASIIYERCEINYIAVEKKYRRRGIAQKLLDYVTTNNNLDTISLEVKSDNIDAINFYLKNGFKKVSIRKKYYGNMDGYLMVKKVR